jgi:hypothetical protein
VLLTAQGHRQHGRSETLCLGGRCAPAACCYLRSNTAGFVAITSPIFAGRLYMYLQSTIRKRPLVSWGWIVSGSFTAPVALASVFVTMTDAGCVGHVAVGLLPGDGVKVSV